MGRPREFNEDEALEKAMQTFWSNGYDATSLADLTSAMGLSKSSLYDTFGSKHALFIAAVERYKATAQSGVIGTLTGALPGREAIETVFRDYVSHAASPDRRGCFLNNCAIEVAASDAEADVCIKAGMARIEEAFGAAIERGQGAGDVATRHEPRALARYLTASFQGLVVMGKADAGRDALSDVVRVTLSALD